VHAGLDLACGHGRVLRHLVKLFPDARFDAADTDTDGVNFCANQFGANPIYSSENLADVSLGGAYDLIWVGSLFTHFSRERVRTWLAHLCGRLSDTGIVVATFHGRYSAARGADLGYIDPSRWAKIHEEYERTGFGYQDYKVHGHQDLKSAYGISLSRASVVIADAEAIPGVRVFSYTERGWAGHHDVLVVGKPGYDA
jgi:cyclopropane fatty-acyl-phospholipid synthase-like methyltransferase